jgi:cell division control protein 6
LTAALAAQESGDARYALKLLLKAGEVADAEGSAKLEEKHVKKARKGVEEEIVYEIISTLPEHQRIVLYAIASLTSEGGRYTRLDGSYEEKVLFSGEVYERYERLCHQMSRESKTARWCREYLNELEMLGLVTTSISGKGVRGNTTLIRLAFPADKVKSVVEKSLGAVKMP